MTDVGNPAAMAGSAFAKSCVAVLAVIAVGLPLNHLAAFALVCLAAVVAVVGNMTSSPQRWMLAAGLAIAIAVIRTVWPVPLIDEGHNVFLPPPAGVSAPGLPAEVQALATRRFDEAYPPEQRCDDPGRGCWRRDRSEAQDGFAFSADALWDRPTYSRRVAAIDFSDPVHARFGVINELIYNWPDDHSDIKRFERDRRSWNVFGRYRMTFPLYVMYRFPAAFVGSSLCWRGDVLWESGDERFETLTNTAMACRTLTDADVNRRIFALAIRLDIPLAMHLVPNGTVRAHGLAGLLLAAAGVIGILFLLVRVRPRQLVFPAILLGAMLAVIAAVDVNFIGGLRPLDGGDDGFTYEGFARRIVRHLLDGDIVAALLGEEKVYYFTPGFRYLRALEHFVFGDTFLGYLALVLALPAMVFALSRRFLPVTWASVIVLLFVATPIGFLFGSSFLYYVKVAARGYADACGQILMLAGLVAIIPPRGSFDDKRVMRAFTAGLLFATATFVRPNLLLTSGAMVLGGTLFALRARNPVRAAALCLGFAALLVSPLHNWVFGHSTVPFSDNVDQTTTLVMSPRSYIIALGDLLRLDVGSDYVRRAVRQIGSWLAGPSEDFVIMAPLHAAAVLALVRVGFGGAKFDPWLRLVALATLLQQGTGACYANSARYHMAMWLLTSLVAIVWSREEGLPLFDRRFPGLRDQWRARPLFKSAAGAIARLNPGETRP